MIVRRLYDEKLAQASYLIGCGATGEALVVDPNRDVGQYEELAARERLRITHVTETHIHADFVSGLRELAEHTGAQAYVSGEGGEGWRYGFASSLGAVELREGDEFRVGNIRIQALHTPGHTPEHLTFLVTDTAGADQPMGALTGDFIFVGDVGRPDLLEKAAGQAGTMESAARTLYASLQRFKANPDWLQLWPGHGAGSACGKALGAMPQSTLGYERLFNWGLATASEAEFVAAVLAGQPEPPRYFAEMKRVNRDGPRVLGGLVRPRQLERAHLSASLAAGVPIVDTRSWAEYAAGAVPGTLNIPLNRSFTNWAGSLLPYDRELELIVAHDVVDEVVRDLAMIGLDRIAGYYSPDAIAAQATARLEEVSVSEAQRLLADGDVALLDVRGESEWDAGHIAGARHIPLGSLPERAEELSRDRPLVVYCQSGSRSAIGASVLAARGFRRVLNLRGGYQEWRAAEAGGLSAA